MHTYKLDLHHEQVCFLLFDQYVTFVSM